MTRTKTLNQNISPSRGPRPLAAKTTASITLALLVAACAGPAAETPAAGSGPDERGGPLSVYVVNYPLMYFAERIGGDLVDVTFPAPADVDPAFWQPGIEVIAAYQSADLIVRNGAGYAKWTAVVSLPDSKSVYTSAAFFEDVIVEEGTVTHTHGPEGEHSHGETAFTTWLDPQQAILQAESIAASLAASLPGSTADIEANMASLRADLEALDQRLAATTSTWDGMPLLASHPVYQYLARRYDINLESVLFEPDEFPDEEHWRILEALHAEHPARWMLWEARPIPSTVDRLKTMGIAVVVFDQSANVPADGDFLDVMRRNADNLQRITDL